MSALEKATTATEHGLRLAVRLTPKASRDAILGFADEADGGAVLKCAVTTVPENGKANAALIKMLAKAWKMPRSHIEVVSGATDRRKILLLHGEPVDLLARLRDKLAS